MKPSGAHTHPDSGGSGSAVLVLLAVIAAAAVAVPVLDALARLAEVFVITLGAVVGVAVLGGAAVAVTRACRSRAIGAARISSPRPVPWRPAEPLSAPRPPALGAPREVHIHLYGASAEDIAAALRQLPPTGDR